MELDIITALFLVGRKCRDPVIRRTAISLLAQNPWREGAWHSGNCAVMSQAVLKIEEEGLVVTDSSCIPENRRTHGLALLKDGARMRAVLTTRPNGIDGDWYAREELLNFSRNREFMY